MLRDLRQPRDADISHAIEIAERTWWVGHVLEDDAFQCHVYLIEQGDQSVLIDPGSRLTFAGSLRKIEQVIPFASIRYFICHHQDPDIAAALPLIDDLVNRDDAVLVTHWRAQALLKHYGLQLPFWLVDEHDWRLPLVDRVLRFIFTPYAHFPGAFCSFDPRTRVLFSSDLFGGFTEQPTLIARDESHFEALRPFHEHYMPSRDILDFAISQIEQYPVRIIAPQHGSIIPPRLVPVMQEKLRRIDCGIYLFARKNTDIQRLSRLNETLRAITQTMLLYRDFRDIAERLFVIVRNHLPTDRIDYYALLDQDQVLKLSQETRFAGSTQSVADAATAMLGKTRAEWEAAHRQDAAFRDYQLHPGPFCSRPDDDGRCVLMLPLFSPELERMDACAEIHLEASTAISADMELVVQQLLMPLQVALEREVIYRGIEQERQRAYQRSIRDPLTGLFTRRYMEDAVARQCDIADRSDNGTPAASVAAVMLDLDHFKRINDELGHAAGDAVLRQCAQILMQMTRTTDIPVRFGGEEFIVFAIGAGASGAAELAERIRAGIEEHRFEFAKGFELGEKRPLQITASLGVARRGPGESLARLIHRADQALYVAKDHGRNQVQLADPQLHD